MTGHAPERDDEAQLTQWLSEARRGDTDAFEHLFAPDSRQRWLIAISASLPGSLRSKVDPEDVLQETLEQAWRDLGTLKEVSTAGFHRWVAGIARHRVTDVMRRYQQPRRDVIREELWPSSSRGAALGNDQTPSKTAARREQWAKITEVLDGLSDTYRAVIIHRILEGCSTEELAEIMGKDRHAVRVTLYRALVKLRTLLDEHGIKSTIFRPL